MSVSCPCQLIGLSVNYILSVYFFLFFFFFFGGGGGGAWSLSCLSLSCLSASCRVALRNTS